MKQHLNATIASNTRIGVAFKTYHKVPRQRPPITTMKYLEYLVLLYLISTEAQLHSLAQSKECLVKVTCWMLWTLNCFITGLLQPLIPAPTYLSYRTSSRSISRPLDFHTRSCCTGSLPCQPCTCRISRKENCKWYTEEKLNIIMISLYEQLLHFYLR